MGIEIWCWIFYVLENCFGFGVVIFSQLGGCVVCFLGIVCLGFGDRIFCICWMCCGLLNDFVSIWIKCSNFVNVIVDISVGIVNYDYFIGN